ncbi:flagellar protein FliT [Azoarcus sp. L1K30]|uniref:flagellar protein FliT n=1 Tax=Azoarcus sp. L1K30 TaxID=2820277 RepID=UPI001B817F47|nr:flagellar protein FliT [Azoarcus sp. L1K30]MBR0564541.1 flagellar protein FliT [Azoarcus sp. L1K30]
MLTLEASNQLLSAYEAMALAAQQNDWDRLAELGRTAEEIRRAAQRAAVPVDQSPVNMEQIAKTVSRILELDQEIRIHAEPALESTRKLLSGAVRDNAVRNAYGNSGL